MKVPMICNSPQPTVVIIAGETSGDLHGARLVNAMLARNQDISFYGVGGPALRQAGVRLSVDAAQLSVVGLTEVFSKLPAILKGLKTVKQLVNRLNPDLLILIDFPDFNLKIAAAAKKLGIPVLYYISPQIWAWRPGRVKQIAKLVDHMAVILPFEEDFYKKHQVPVTFVGHPLLDDHLPERSEACQQRNAAQPIIGLLPGSRESEILRHVPVMLETAKILQTMLKNVQFFISHAPSVERKHLEKLVQDHACNVDLEIISDPVQDVFKRCSLVVAASGTVTLQAALHGVPMVIIYKVSPLSFWFGRALVRVNNIGLVNLIAGNEIAPELVQYHASAVNIAATVSDLMTDSTRRRRMRQELVNIRDLLGGPGASERVADIALEMI
jgi:lipid-A-disaccharide synthase